jgi:hypothetical protein
MNAHAMHTTDVTTAQLGWVLAHDLHARDGHVLLRKGTVLNRDALEQWPEAAAGEVHLLELDPDDLHEDAGGLRIARAVAGNGIRVSGPLQSRYELVAERKGLLRVDAGLLSAVNHVKDVTVYTLLDRQPVLPGKIVANVKVTPIVVPAARVAAVERLCREAARPPLVVLPFQCRRVAVVAVEAPNPEQRARFEAAIERKVRWYGSRLSDLRYVAPDAGQVAEAFRACQRDGADLLLAAGGNTIDPLDPVVQALPLVGARLVHRGAPTRGSMFWLAQSGDVPIVNLASCSMYTGNTVADLVLPLLMTGQQVTPDDIIAIAYGGLPGPDMALRFPPYDAEASDEAEAEDTD